MIQDARLAPFTLREYLAFAAGSESERDYSQRPVWHREHGRQTAGALLQLLTDAELDSSIVVRRVNNEYHLLAADSRPADPIARLRINDQCLNVEKRAS